MKSKKGIGVYQVLTKILTGEKYVISCWIKAGEGINQRGGSYCGAGCSFVIYSSDWKQAKSTNCKTEIHKENGKK